MNRGKRNCIRDHILSENIAETIVTNYSICMEQTSFMTSKCEVQSGNKFCPVNNAKREQEKPLLFKLTLRSRSTLSQARSDTCHELLVVFGLSTLNSNRTNHKSRKKLANQNADICPCHSAGFEHDIVH